MNLSLRVVFWELVGGKEISSYSEVWGGCLNWVWGFRVIRSKFLPLIWPVHLGHKMVKFQVSVLGRTMAERELSNT